MSAELLPRLKPPLIIWSKFASKTPKPTSSGFDQKYLESSRIQIKKIVQAVLSCNHWCWLQCIFMKYVSCSDLYIFHRSTGMYSGVHRSAFLFLVCCSHTCWKAAMGKQLMSKYKASWHQMPISTTWKPGSRAFTIMVCNCVWLCLYLCVCVRTLMPVVVPTASLTRSLTKHSIGMPQIMKPIHWEETPIKIISVESSSLQTHPPSLPGPVMGQIRRLRTLSQSPTKVSLSVWAQRVPETTRGAPGLLVPTLAARGRRQHTNTVCWWRHY